MPALRDMVTVFTVPGRPMLNRLFCHFTEFAPTWLSIEPGLQRKEFLTHVIPMALESSVIMNCIFAVSAADLTKYQGEECEMEIIALEMHNSALEELNVTIERETMRDSLTLEDTSVSGNHTHHFQISFSRI